MIRTSNLTASKWLFLAAVGFLAAFGCEVRAKQLAGAAAVSIAERTAGIAVRDDPLRLARSSDFLTFLGLCVAGVGLLCWVISALRREPASSLWALIPAILYGFLFLLLV